MKRTKKLHADLFDQPTLLSPGVEILLGGDGLDQITLRDVERGHTMRLRVSVGKHGMSLTVSRPGLGTPLSITGNLDRDGNYEPLKVEGGASEIVVTQYNDTDAARAFKRWYFASPEERKAQGIAYPDDKTCGGVVR